MIEIEALRERILSDFRREDVTALLLRYWPELIDAARREMRLRKAIEHALVSIRICALPMVAGVADNATILRITADGLSAALKDGQLLTTKEKTV